jgi:hypothetical protein
LTPALVATLRPTPDLVITVDNGISSIAGIAAAKARGCSVIDTDHHLPGAAIPDADAIVNPNLFGDAFASKALCGVGVMFYLLLALRARLGKRDDVDLASLLDLVALGTVADLVPLDANNRTLVEGGLRRMRAGKACAGMSALFEISSRDLRSATAADLAYAVAPRINAAGRLEDMTLGVECLLCDDATRARQLAVSCTTSMHNGAICRRRWSRMRWRGSPMRKRASRSACRCSIRRGTPAWWDWSPPRSRNAGTARWWRSRRRARATNCAARRARCRASMFAMRWSKSMRVVPISSCVSAATRWLRA